MLVESLRLAMALLVLVVLPGHLLVNVLFPRGALARLERGYLTVAAGVLLLITTGVVLGFLPHDGDGHFSTIASGMPNLELAMLGVMAALFWLGLHRGAYPGIARRYPHLLTLGARSTPAEPGR